MGRPFFAVSLASDGPIALDSQPGSVLGEKHLVHRRVVERLRNLATHIR